MNTLPKVVAPAVPEWESNLQPRDRYSNALPTAPLCHVSVITSFNLKIPLISQYCEVPSCEKNTCKIKLVFTYAANIHNFAMTCMHDSLHSWLDRQKEYSLMSQSTTLTGRLEDNLPTSHLTGTSKYNQTTTKL